MGLRLSFHGGAGTVTGSRHLLESDEAKVLVDAGLFQGLKKLRLLNWEKPGFDPRALDALILTHTHIDHAGYLPRLVNQGFRAEVWCTEATADLAEIMLLDAAKIQEEDAEHANRNRYSKHDPALALFDADDAERALKLFRPVEYEQWFEPAKGIKARFFNAGHILGSAMAEIRVRAGGKETSIVFSGDIGKSNMPLHPDPEPPPSADYLVVESTYGDRVHDPEPFLKQVGGPIRKCLSQGGTVLVPAFAVARSQMVTLILREAMKAGEIPEVPVHIDSPMAINATDLYTRYLDRENLDPDLVDEGRVRLFPGNVRFHRTRDESMELNGLPGPRVIISASGMLTAGRVLHHLKRILPDEKNLVLLVGYQAPGTRGRALQDGTQHLRVHGRDIPVRASHLLVHGLSAHADRNELFEWVSSMRDLPRKVFVVHGEPESSKSFAELIEKELGVKTMCPELGDSVSL